MLWPLGADAVGPDLWNQYKRWPVYSKFFDNMGPIPHHMHHNWEQAALVEQEGKPEGYYFPPQHNSVPNNFAYTFFGLNPGTDKSEVRRCLENWHRGDNGILDLSQAYRLKPGTGWLVPPGVLHAPGSLCAYEPQWGSDVFGMYQNPTNPRCVAGDRFTCLTRAGIRTWTNGGCLACKSDTSTASSTMWRISSPRWKPTSRARQRLGKRWKHSVCATLCWPRPPKGAGSRFSVPLLPSHFARA